MRIYSKMVYIASFDIGKKNFCFYIEDTYIEEIKSLVPPTTRYNENGTLTSGMISFMEDIYASGNSILHKNLDLTINSRDKSAYLDSEIYYNMYDVLDEHKEEYFDKCEYIIIEMQMSFKGKHNTMALKLGQHCYSWFVANYGRDKIIVEFPAYYKTQILGAPKVEGKKYKNGKTQWKSMDKREIKKWSVDKCIEILNCRGEMNILDNILTQKKKDDLADVLVQLQAWKVVSLIDKKI